MSVALAPDGDVYAGGYFATAGGVAAARIARWDGANWHALGSGATTYVTSILAHSNSDVFAAGGLFTIGANLVQGVVRWDGSAWHDVGNMIGVLTLLELPDGDVLAGGQFSSAEGVPANNVARWDGSGWHPLGSGVPFLVTDLAVHPNGDLVAVGDVGMSRWDGTSWTSIGSPGLRVNGVAVNSAGQLACAGFFVEIDGLPSRGFGILETSCPAGVVDNGGGCPSSGGANEYAAANGPWTGATFEATGTGLPMSAFVATVTGFGQTSLPLSAVLPAGQPGCSLLVTPEIAAFGLSNAGTFVSALPIPNDPSLSGTVLHRQLIALEVSGLVFPEITASNSLSITIGTF